MKRYDMSLLLVIAAIGCGDVNKTDSGQSGDPTPDDGAGAARRRVTPDDGAKKSAAEKTRLTLTLLEGQTFVLENTTNQTITSTIAGRPISVSQQVVLHTRQTVESIDSDGVAIIDVEFIRVKIDQRGGALSGNYDSEEPPDGPPPPTPFASLKGRRFTKHVARDGSIVKLEGAEQLLREMFDANPADYGPAQQAYREMVSSIFDGAGLEDMEQIATPIFPKHEIGPGDQWENRVVIEKVMPAILYHTYEVVRRSGGEMIVSLKTDVQPNDAADPVLKRPETVLVLSGRQTGTLTIDEKTGLTIAKTVHQNLSGRRVVRSPDSEESTEVPITVRGTTEFKIVRDPPTDE